MANITLGGNAITTVGELPAVGAKAPSFTLRNTSLEDVTLDNYAGKTVVLNIFPSVDTGVCATSVRTFNERAASMDNAVVLNVSADLPFAHKRFCGAEGIENVEGLSTMESSFLEDYGVRMNAGALRGLASRAIVVIGTDGNVAYTEQVPEIAQEPNYDAALAAI